MTSSTRPASGAEYLDLVTRLLQRSRLDHPTAGLWEAADLQWWWRTPRSTDAGGQVFWLDGHGDPEAAVILTDWGDRCGCDVIVRPGVIPRLLDVVWDGAIERIAARGDVEMLVRDDDAALSTLATTAGFVAGADTGVAAWMDAADRPAVAPLAEGFHLLDRSESAGEPHHFIRRSGPAVAERLAQTSLYRPDLDLFIRAPDGGVAAYGLFWFDPVTGVGLVEPMRTEDPYQRRGLARHLLTAGLDRLASAGARRLKIGYESTNEAATTLYLATGFQPDAPSTAYVRA